MQGLILSILLLVAARSLYAMPMATRAMKLGVDADNWSDQVHDPRFEKSLRLMGIDFISWHLQPEEEENPAHLQAIVEFCRRNNWQYLFNNEVGNYRRDENRFKHPDGTYRYDFAEQTLQHLKNDPLFIGVIYDEADLMQSVLGVIDEKGRPIPPYFANTKNMPLARAFEAVSDKVAELTKRYAYYGKRLVFEMTFPDYPFAFTRGGAIVAPKLLKENFNDLMVAVYRGAALEYHSRELWACVDLWFLDKFPTEGKQAAGYHTPAQLLETLQFADANGFDYVYIEQIKALTDKSYNLTDYGRKVVEFQGSRSSREHGDWRTSPVELYVKRFPDGYWGQSYSAFLPDHPYGSWDGNPYRSADEAWFKTLESLSHGVIPSDADTWNATRSQHFSRLPYQTMAGLPAMVVIDQFGDRPPHSSAKLVDLYTKQR